MTLPGLDQATKIAIRLCWLTGSRRTEVVEARIAEFDLIAKRWRIPGAKLSKGRSVRGRTKNSDAKIVPLSPPALRLVTRAIELAGSSAFLLPGSAATGTMEAHSLTTAMARITKRLNIEDLNLHDGRSALRTWSRDEGVDVSVLDSVVGHRGKSVGARHYEAPSLTFIEKRVRPALDAWGTYVLRTVRETLPTSSLPATRYRRRPLSALRRAAGFVDA